MRRDDYETPMCRCLRGSWARNQEAKRGLWGLVNPSWMGGPAQGSSDPVCPSEKPGGSSQGALTLTPPRH